MKTILPNHENTRVVFFSHLLDKHIFSGILCLRQNVSDMSTKRIISIAVPINPGIHDFCLTVTGSGSKHLVHPGVQLLGCRIKGRFLLGHRRLGVVTVLRQILQ